MPALVLDFDGLMVDSEYVMAAAVIEVVTARGAELAMEDISHLFGSVDVDHEWDAILRRRCGDDYTLAHLEDELWSFLPARIDALPLMPGVIEALEAARDAGWPVGLASGQERPRLGGHLKRLGVTDHFDVVVTRRDVERGKPFPDIYLATAERLGVPAADCLVLEDSIPGCEAALAAGMRVIACPSRVTAGCVFPAGVSIVTSLTDLCLTDVAPS